MLAIAIAFIVGAIFGGSIAVMVFAAIIAGRADDDQRKIESLETRIKNLSGGLAEIEMEYDA